MTILNEPYDEFTLGYMDGRDPMCPEPSDNRPHRYRHSFGVARRELLNNNSHWPADYARRQAYLAEVLDGVA